MVPAFPCERETSRTFRVSIGCLVTKYGCQEVQAGMRVKRGAGALQVRVEGDDVCLEKSDADEETKEGSEAPVAAAAAAAAAAGTNVVVVGGGESTCSLAVSPASRVSCRTNTPPLIIVGDPVTLSSGVAAFQFAHTLAANRFGGVITLLTEEDSLPYDRTKLSKVSPAQGDAG